MSQQSNRLVPLLVGAHADAEAANGSGLTALSELLDGGTGGVLSAASPASGGEQYHCLRAIGTDPKQGKGLFSMALNFIRAPVRDTLRFASNAKAKDLAQMSAAEEDPGVFSDWVTNYTHAGLEAAADPSQPDGDPGLSHRSCQALIITTERLLLFNARSWSLACVLALSEVKGITVSPRCASLFVLRLHRLPDLVLDTAPTVRARLLEELQVAANTQWLAWGGEDFGDGLEVVADESPMLRLFGHGREPTATLAFVEADVFLLVPFAPRSLLLGGRNGAGDGSGACAGDPDGDGGDANGDATGNAIVLAPTTETLHFGLLDAHEGSGASWRWRTFVVVLHGGGAGAGRVAWCGHPCDEQCAGEAQLSRIRTAQPLDTPYGEPCLILEVAGDVPAADSPAAARGATQDAILTFRAASARGRDAWIDAIRLELLRAGC